MYLAPVISSPQQEGIDTSVLGVLLPTRSDAPPFRGRAAELTRLRTWLDRAGSHPLIVIAGPAGTGKTRLATQFAAALPARWAAGWVREDCFASAVAAVQAYGQPTLLLVDDAETRADLPALLTSLATASGGPSVRAILICRNVSALARLASRLPDGHRWILGDSLPVVAAGLFGTEDDQARWYGEAVRGYAHACGTPPPDLPAAISHGAAAAVGQPILAVHAAALLAVLESQRHRPGYTGTRRLPFDQVAAGLFSHEQHRWQEASHHLTGFDTETQARVITVMILTSAADEDQAAQALRAVPELHDATAERRTSIARWAFGLYPADPPGPVRIQPDMLTEWFLVTQLTATPTMTGNLSQLSADHAELLLAVLAHASDHLTAAVSLFTRIITASPATLAAPAITAALTAQAGQARLDIALAAVVTNTSWPVGMPADLEGQISAGALPRTRMALATATVSQLRQAGTQPDLATALNNRSLRLRDLGQYQQALANLEEALGLWRDLAAASPAHQPQLAAVLNNRGLSLT